MYEKRKNGKCKITHNQTSAQAKLQRLLQEIFHFFSQKWRCRDTTFVNCGLVYRIVTLCNNLFFFVFISDTCICKK